MGAEYNAVAGGVTPQPPPLFSGIPSAEYQRIYSVARKREFARGERLFIEGDAVEHVVLLTAGFAKVTQLGTSGSQVILRFGTPGDVLGVDNLFSGGVHCRTAEAFRVCEALVWDARSFKNLVDRWPVLNLNMARLAEEELFELEERFREVATERVAPRVARQLLRLMEKIGHSVGGEIEVCLSREELAQMTGTTLFTVSRLLSAWELRGIVRPRREGVTICDVPPLRSLSE